MVVGRERRCVAAFRNPDGGPVVRSNVVHDLALLAGRGGGSKANWK